MRSCSWNSECSFPGFLAAMVVDVVPMSVVDVMKKKKKKISGGCVVARFGVWTIATCLLPLDMAPLSL